LRYLESIDQISQNLLSAKCSPVVYHVYIQFRNFCYAFSVQKKNRHSQCLLFLNFALHINC